MVRNLDGRLPTIPARILSAGMTHLKGAGPGVQRVQEPDAAEGFYGTEALPWLVQGGDNHKLQAGAQHDRRPSASVIPAMAPAAVHSEKAGTRYGRQP